MKNKKITHLILSSLAAIALPVLSSTAQIVGADAYLKGNNTAASDYFGYSVSVSGDGNRFAAGAVGEDGSSPGVNGVDNNSAGRAGAVSAKKRRRDL